MIPLDDTEVRQLASSLLNKENPNGVPYFQGYVEHVEIIIKTVMVELSHKNK